VQKEQRSRGKLKGVERSFCWTLSIIRCWRWACGPSKWSKHTGSKSRRRIKYMLRHVPSGQLEVCGAISGLRMSKQCPHDAVFVGAFFQRVKFSHRDIESASPYISCAVIHVNAISRLVMLRYARAYQRQVHHCLTALCMLSHQSICVSRMRTCGHIRKAARYMLGQHTKRQGSLSLQIVSKVGVPTEYSSWGHI
jgi:hypothetical protein